MCSVRACSRDPRLACLLRTSRAAPLRTEMAQPGTSIICLSVSGLLLNSPNQPLRRDHHLECISCTVVLRDQEATRSALNSGSRGWIRSFEAVQLETKYQTERGLWAFSVGFRWTLGSYFLLLMTHFRRTRCFVFRQMTSTRTMMITPMD